ncbi:DUF4832 domain-containing protein [Aeromonas hydrophila]|uniref:DUF4832 domain-containing protein n=1 Tax=Aeromonas hydrophila TaxID=644 RepID=UPI0038D1484D
MKMHQGRLLLYSGLLWAHGALAGTLTLNPEPVNDLLNNPGVGLEEFHDSWGQTLSLEQHPTTTVDYFRFYWSELEPAEGQYNFALIDAAIAQAQHETPRQMVALRVMTLDEPFSGSKIPGWLIDKGIRGEWVNDHQTFVPDYGDPLFIERSKRLFQALGARYDGNPALSHIDIGMIGSWGEWHMSNFPGPTLEQRYSSALLKQYVDLQMAAFAKTPRLMLINHLPMFEYAVGKGAGWRADCLGDWHHFSQSWSHMRDAYPERLASARAHVPGFDTSWQRAPVSFEVCGKLSEWPNQQQYSQEDVQATFDWALAQHVSTINLKSDPVPPQYRTIVDNALRKMGYRIVLDQLVLKGPLQPGTTLTLSGNWHNEGVAPAYQNWPLTYRLVNDEGQVGAMLVTRNDMTRWIPGHGFTTLDSLTLPGRMAAGRYYLELAFIGRDKQPALQLGIAGREDNGWYRLTELDIQ